MERKKTRNWPLILLYICIGIVFILGCILAISALWVNRTFCVSFTELLYTLANSLDGTGGNMFGVTLRNCLLPALPIALGYGAAVWFFGFWLPEKKKPILRRLMPAVMGAVALFTCICAFLCADRLLQITDYFEARNARSTLYEEHFVPEEEANPTAPEQKKNLLMIYLESMEPTYASREAGGNQPVNYMPFMTALARDQISFSDKEGLGGFISVPGTTWTMGALFATSSGIPFSFPVGENSMGKYDLFASGVTALGDILERDGYYNQFLCGSDIAFAGRDKYFRDHGSYDLYDLHTARQEGVIPNDYFVFWGYEDYILYDIAKKELTALSQKNQPFNLTMLTVDPHHIGGYVCPKCGNDYKNQTANVISCADRLLEDFIAWCQQQPFYEDTVIVIIGDHPRMDNNLTAGLSYEQRPVYNCFMNTDIVPQGAVSNRTFTAMDIFPTVLAALNYQMEGDRIGLGTNMFSGAKTLAEELGLGYLQEEIRKYSVYYERFY